MTVRTRILDQARHRARVVRIEIGQGIRNARLAAGLPLREVARVIGRSASWLSRVERGLVAGVTMDELIVASAAVGLKLWVTTFAAERAIRDAPQLMLLRRFRERIGEAWDWSYEVIVPLVRDQRAADAVIRNGSTVVMIEAFTRLADAQAQFRAILLKARDMGIERVIILVGESRANRRALELASDVLASDFPLRTRTILRALAEGRDPGANGIVVL
ncbi:MAG: helix-turn-helix domain-containing protein [Candidatus Limnocylindria bacterium]